MKRYRIVLLTGASSGIGKEIAYAIAPQAERIVLVARRTEKIEEIARDLSLRFGVSAFALPADLSVPGEASRVFEKTVELAGDAPDLLVNDAGVGFQGRASEIPVDMECKMLRVNIESLMVLSKLALQAMQGKRRGVILNVSSMAGFQPGPYMAAYYATKAFVLSYSEALAEEARNSRVRVLVLCPGFVDTEFHFHAGSRKGSLRCLFRSSAQSVAWEAVRAILGGKSGIVVPGNFNKILLFAERFLSRRLVVKTMSCILHRGK